MNGMRSAAAETKTPEPARGRTKLAYFDANGDGELDLYIGTDLKLGNDDNSYLGDFILHGPEFKTSHWLGASRSGTGMVKNYDSESVVVARAGRGWSGKVFLLTSTPPN